jgi:hypothetical protein
VIVGVSQPFKRKRQYSTKKFVEESGGLNTEAATIISNFNTHSDILLLPMKRLEELSYGPMGPMSKVVSWVTRSLTLVFVEHSLELA